MVGTVSIQCAASYYRNINAVLSSICPLVFCVRRMITVSNIYSNKKHMHETHATISQKKVFFNRNNAAFVGETIIKIFFLLAGLYTLN